MTASHSDSSAPAGLDFSAMDAAYRPPAYFRVPFREYLCSFDKGIYWLRSPDATGKSMFVRGLYAKRLGKDKKTLEGIDSNVATGMRVVAVHLNKEGCSEPRPPRNLVETVDGDEKTRKALLGRHIAQRHDPSEKVGKLDESDKLWADTIDRSERRFALVSLILRSVAGGYLALDKVADLPKGEAMRAGLAAATPA